MTPTEAELLLLSSPLRNILDHLPEHVPPEVAVYARGLAHYPLFEQKAVVWLPRIWAAEGGHACRKLRVYNLLVATYGAYSTVRECREAVRILRAPEVRQAVCPFDVAITQVPRWKDGQAGRLRGYYAFKVTLEHASRVQNNTNPSEIKIRMAELLSQLPRYKPSPAHIHFLLNHFNLFLFPEQQVPP